jgi:hypothetical protein
MSAIFTLLSFLSMNSGTLDQPAPASAYTAANVNGEIEQHLAFVRACYVAHPSRPGGHGGKRLRLLFRLATDGRVETAIIKHDSLDSSAAADCVRRIARTWRFPAPPASGAQFEYSFRFQ